MKKIDHIVICCIGKVSTPDKEKAINQLINGLPKTFLSCRIDDITNPPQWTIIQKSFKKNRGKKNPIIDLRYESEINLLQVYSSLRKLAKINNKTIKLVTINFLNAKGTGSSKSKNAENPNNNADLDPDLTINKLKIENGKTHLESNAFGTRVKITCENFQKVLEFLTFAQTN